MKFKTTRTLASVALVGGLAIGVLPVVSSASTPTFKDSTINSNFTTMKYLKSVVAKGKGLIGVILPDTITSARYVEFDAPYLARALKAAGLKSRQFIIQNAQGSDAAQYTMAQADIAKGAKVLLFDPLDSTTGGLIESYAKAHGVKTIDYDRLTLGGQRTYYVSFNNVAVGTLIGKGETACLAAWKVPSPVVMYISYGAPTDNNATLFADGYNAVLKAAGFNTTSTTTTGSFQSVLQSAGTWDNAGAATDFEGAYAAHPSINAVLAPNDGTAAAIITYLQGLGLKPQTLPIGGQDAQLTGLENIVSGYQCGTVYKPIWEEAQAAAALAVYLRAGIKPPKGIVNGTTRDSILSENVPSALLVPEWVTAATLANTVIKDGQVKAAQLCTNTAPSVKGFTAPTYAADCTTYGIH